MPFPTNNNVKISFHISIFELIYLDGMRFRRLFLRTEYPLMLHNLHFSI